MSQNVPRSLWFHNSDTHLNTSLTTSCSVLFRAHYMEFKCGCHYLNFSGVNAVLECVVNYWTVCICELFLGLFTCWTHHQNRLQKNAHVSTVTNSDLTLSWRQFSTEQLTSDRGVWLFHISWSSASHFRCVMQTRWLFMCSIVSRWDCVWPFLSVYWCQTHREKLGQIHFFTFSQNVVMTWLLTWWRGGFFVYCFFLERFLGHLDQHIIMMTCRSTE